MAVGSGGATCSAVQCKTTQISLSKAKSICTLLCHPYMHPDILPASLRYDPLTSGENQGAHPQSERTSKHSEKEKERRRLGLLPFLHSFILAFLLVTSSSPPISLLPSLPLPLPRVSASASASAFSPPFLPLPPPNHQTLNHLVLPPDPSRHQTGSRTCPPISQAKATGAEQGRVKPHAWSRTAARLALWNSHKATDVPDHPLPYPLPITHTQLRSA